MLNPNIQFTPAAQAFIKKMLVKEAGHFRLSIKKTGCSGFSYVPAIVKEINSADATLSIADVTVYVDVSWLHLLEGLTVDYVEEEKLGLKQKRLVFINPKEASRCGCGESFHVES